MRAEVPGPGAARHHQLTDLRALAMSVDLGFAVSPPTRDFRLAARSSQLTARSSQLAARDSRLATRGTFWLDFGPLTSQNVVHFGILDLVDALFCFFAMLAGHFGRQTAAL